MGLHEIPVTFEERSKAIRSDLGKPIRELFTDEGFNDVLKTHEADHNYWADKTLEEEVIELLDKY